MAKFVKQTSDVAQALNRLQGLAENVISFETNRRIQLGREKEARMVDAYQYMLGNEEQEISELEASLDAIELNLQTRGVELKSVKDQYKTIASEELLAAANEGAVELVNAKLQDSKNHRDSLQSRKSQAMQIKRQIDLFDDAMSLADPAHYGDKGIIDAEDVANAAKLYREQEDVIWAPEMQQRLEALQTESQLERLNTDYYAKLARESEQKLTAAESDFATADIRNKRFEIIKKETAEGTRSKLRPVISGLLNQLGHPAGLRKDIETGVDSFTGENLSTAEEKQKRQEMAQAYHTIGAIFAPWAKEGLAVEEAQRLQVAVTNAQNGNYQPLVDYFKKGNYYYNQWLETGDKRAELYEEDMFKYFGINLQDEKHNWIRNLEEMWNASVRADEEQGEEQLKMGMDMFSEPLIDESDYSGRRDDLELFNQGEW